MRTGKEREEWERLSFLAAHAAVNAGVKDVKVEKFNKFTMDSVKRVNNPTEVKRRMLG